MTPQVLGLDLSLTCTGLAGAGWTAHLKPSAKLRGPERLLWIRARLADEFLNGVTLAVLEGPSFGSAAGQRGHHERGGLWWLVRCQLLTAGIPTAVVPPAARAKYATGRGNAGKADVIREVTRRFPWFEGGEDEADALVLAAMGADHLGAPLAPMPAIHRTALAGVDWPALPALESEALEAA
jgi:crossover junction endodeoxyribonuclease RuvC